MSRILPALLLLALAAPASAQQRPDSDWPCVQRKVATLGAGTVWTGPDLAGAAGWTRDFQVAALAQKLAARRTPLEDVDPLIDTFAAQAGAEKSAKLTELFAGVFDLINTERGRVIEGIGRYARGQQRYAARIRDEADRISAVKDSPDAPTPDGLKDTETQFTWDKRVFEERSQALGYVCEVPLLLEQRLGEIARRIQARL